MIKGMKTKERKVGKFNEARLTRGGGHGEGGRRRRGRTDGWKIKDGMNKGWRGRVEELTLSLS